MFLLAFIYLSFNCGFYAKVVDDNIINFKDADNIYYWSWISDDFNCSSECRLYAINSINQTIELKTKQIQIMH
jgi:hypothetical protein